MNKEEKEARKAFRREAGEAVRSNLIRLRKRTGLSQEDLSLRAGLNRTHVGLIENGKRLPEIDTVYRLAGALGIRPGDLLTGFSWAADDLKPGGQATDEQLK